MATAWADANNQPKEVLVNKVRKNVLLSEPAIKLKLSLLLQLSSVTAVGYNGSAADVASTVSYLVSKEAHFITGQSVSTFHFHAFGILALF